MSDKNNGGPVYPSRENPDDPWTHLGLTMRDYFAAQTLPAILHHYGFGGGTEQHARQAYAYADAMLAERDK